MSDIVLPAVEYKKVIGTLSIYANEGAEVTLKLPGTAQPLTLSSPCLLYTPSNGASTGSLFLPFLGINSALDPLVAVPCALISLGRSLLLFWPLSAAFPFVGHPTLPCSHVCAKIDT